MVYILSRTLDLKSDISDIIRLFRMTPLYCAVISEAGDHELAAQFTTEIARAYNEEDALAIARYFAKESEMPVLLIGTANRLDTFYEEDKWLS